jgi:replicative DNA helicase
MPGFEPTQPPAARAEQLHNHAEVRHGPTGTIELFFEPDLTRFSSVERRHG